MPEHSFCLRIATFSDVPLLLGMMEEFYKEEQIPFERERGRTAIEELLGTPALGTIFLVMLEEHLTSGAREGVEKGPSAGNSRLLSSVKGAFSVTQPSANNPRLSEERAIGYLVAIQSFILEFGGRQTFLDELYISEEWRGRGYGRLALAAVEDFARKSGCRALRLEVAHTNMRALNMYARAGFERHDRYTMTKVLRW